MQHVNLVKCHIKCSIPNRHVNNGFQRIFGRQQATTSQGREQNKTKQKDETMCSKQNDPDSSRSQYNPVKIQMISKKLHQQIFRKSSSTSSKHTDDFNKVSKHLKSFDLWGMKTNELPDVDIDLPDLYGSNIDEHFRELASQQIRPYLDQVKLICESDMPQKPKEWIFKEGWTKYDPVTGDHKSVAFPEEDAMVFDVEVLMMDGNFPTMATAVTPKAWYSWCSHRLLADDVHWNKQYPQLDDLIPLELESKQKYQDVRWRPCVVIGHNVGFDRTFIKEQYFIKGSQLRFLDTMALHIAVSGLTGLQRILYVANKTGSRRKEVVEHEQDQAMFGNSQSSEWMKNSSLNNLSDVYQLYCKGEPLDKSTRDVFVKGTMSDVREQFQKLMSYCASDVEATWDVFKKIWPQFQERFPHPVTLSGMLEMGTAYLPINKTWEKYISQSDDKYKELQQEVTKLLQRLAIEAYEMGKEESYKNNVWLWDLDWTSRQYKYKAVKKTKKSIAVPAAPELSPKQPHMPGFPKWYAELCPKAQELMEGASPGPSKLSTQRRITPKLLNLVWEGYPLHYNDTHGWGYVVPRVYKTETENDVEMELDKQDEILEKKKSTKFVASPEVYPINSLLEIVSDTDPQLMKQLKSYTPNTKKAEDILDKLHSNTGEEDPTKLWAQYKKLKTKKKTNGFPKPVLSQPGIGPYHDVLPGCDFYKLIHKDGEQKRVANPLAKDFLGKIEEGILRSYSGNDAEIVLKCSKMCSYWKNNMARIKSQVTVYLSKENLPDAVTCDPAFEEEIYGAILPRVVTAGTVTRRAVESTWLTASNAYVDRVGSELKSMIQAPPGYHFVGADVDSQELWIASILGDSHFAGIHGCTAFGWMTLQGNKTDGTDLHSRTAELVGISRDHAKVLTYGRIYGAGVRFAEQLLRQFNPRLTQQEAKSKATRMYKSTKGRKVKEIIRSGDEEDPEEHLVQYWKDGSESHMFNKLEEIALSDKPRTPVLGCMISKALEPQNVAGDFMTSRVNWAVQSSAVDYLHLMLVCMRWLFQKYDIDGRFCISIHDEVRYTVRSEDRYRAALALQITNLLTRAMFAYKLNMNDLPRSVAFFSAVDIDSCLRKEVTMDCVTPSNPAGLGEGYNIPKGEAMTIGDILSKTDGSLEKTDDSELTDKAHQVTVHLSQSL